MEDLTINYYHTEFPEKGDIVFIKMLSHNNISINCKIIEYPNYHTIMSIADLTTKKKIFSIAKYISKNPVPAEVIDVDKDKKYIQVSRSYLKKDDIKKHNKKYNERIRLYKLIDSVQYHYNTHFNTNHDKNYFIKNVLWKITELYQTHNINNDTYIMDFLEQNINTIDYNVFYDTQDIVKNILYKTFKNKPTKYISKFSLISIDNISNIKNIFDNINKIKFERQFTPKLDSTPIWYIESTGVSEEQYHKQYLSKLSELARINKVSFKINS